MFDQSGFDYDLLVHRLHRGACAFQSLRAHRRQRGAAPEPTPVTEVRAPNPPPTPPPPVPNESDDLRVTGSREPQAFVAVGGRVVPIFGDVNAVLGAPAGHGAPPMDESLPPPPRAAPTRDEVRPAAPPTPAVSASTLKLPVPTPPPRLGLVNSGHARPSAPQPASTTPTDPAATPTAGRTASAEDAPSTQEAAAYLAAIFDTHAQQEVVRLEKLHADHRAALATLLQEHREELRARSEADATRTAELLREVLAEHRADLARSAQTHAEHLAQATQPGAADHDLRSALIEQAKLQREAHEDVADHISALTSIVADLGQTVGLLAVAAAQEAKQGRPTFTAPPLVEPSADAPPPAPGIEAAPPDVPPTAAAPVSTPSAASCGDPSIPYRATHTPASSHPPGSVTTTAVPTIPATPLAEASAAQRRLARAQEAAAQARVRQFADEDRDEDDLETGIDDDDDPPRRRLLPPITDIDPPKIRERDHG